MEVFHITDSEISSSWPSDIHAIIDQCSHLFDKPTGLPPQRHINHTIPLMEGAQPFRLRSYRYNPAQIDEIEKHVKELVENGLIKDSIVLAHRITGSGHYWKPALC